MLASFVLHGRDFDSHVQNLEGCRKERFACAEDLFDAGGNPLVPGEEISASQVPSQFLRCFFEAIIRSWLVKLFDAQDEEFLTPARV